MTKDLIKTLIAEYQQYVTRVKLIPRQVKFIDGQNYVLEIGRASCRERV